MNDFDKEPRPRSPLDVNYEYRSMGLETSVSQDESDKHYSPHFHDHDVRIFVMEGGIRMRMEDGDWQLYERGGEISIPARTVHEAKVESDGWTFLVGIPKDAEHPFEAFDPPPNSNS